MDIVKAFNNNNIGIEITIRGTYGEPLFRASDIGAVLDIRDIKSSIRDFDETQKVKHVVKTTGGPQTVTFLTEKGLKRIICKCRKSNAIDLAKQLGIDTNDIFHIPLEISLVNFIKRAYPDDKIIHQFIIDQYKVDLFFPDYKLIIECDEYFHIYQKEDDEKRENYIKNKIEFVKFIRLKQDKKNNLNNLAELVFKINKHKLEFKN